MKLLATIGLSLFLFCVQAQNSINPLSLNLTLSDKVPEGLLAGKSCVLYSSNFSEEELDKIQNVFQNTGIDAVAYFENELVFSGREVTQKIADQLSKREVSFIILATNVDIYSFLFTPFNGNNEFVNSEQEAWSITSVNLNDALQNIYRTAVNSQPIKNLLINSYPERSFPIGIIEGRRSDFFAIDLKVDRLAVPWFKDAKNDTTLAYYLKENYPFNYGMVEPGLDKNELRSKGFHYVLHYLHTKGALAKEVLGYQKSASESAITSVTYPNGEVQLKTLSAETPVYKFYSKHIESGNVFLGTKWDADITWQEALRNHLKGFKAELKIN